MDKYAYMYVKGKLEDKGYETTLDAFVVGTLGKWDPKKDQLLSTLRIGCKYGILFKKLFYHDAIAGSYEVWVSKCRRHQPLLS